MRNRVRPWTIPVVCALGVVGCGTMANFDSQGRSRAGKTASPEPFGGVGIDFKYAAGVIAAGAPAPNMLFVGMPMCALYMVDVPFSLVADTLTLPLLWASKQNVEEPTPPTGSRQDDAAKHDSNEYNDLDVPLPTTDKSVGKTSGGGSSLPSDR